MNDLEQDFKAAMASYPAGVVIVTTLDAHGEPQGFTATSFSSLSLHPPSILVCVSKTAFCYDAFVQARHFVVNFVDAEHESLAMRFARKGEDKFGASSVKYTEQGIPALTDAATVIECEQDGHFISGDHAILVGNVKRIRMNEERDVLIYAQRRFGRFAQSGMGS